MQHSAVGGLDEDSQVSKTESQKDTIHLIYNWSLSTITELQPPKTLFVQGGGNDGNRENTWNL
jgi:hypothetical protein